VRKRGNDAASDNDDMDEEESFVERMIRRKREKHASHAYFSDPLRSGIIEINDDVNGKIKEAYFLVQEHCAGLKGLPLDAFKMTRANEVGLASDFANFVGALFADATTLFPDSYKSAKTQDRIKLRKAEMMSRLKKYKYTRRYLGSTPESYQISVKNERERQ